MNSAFVGYKELYMQISEAVIYLGLNLHNPTQPHSLIAKYLCIFSTLNCNNYNTFPVPLLKRICFPMI